MATATDLATKLAYDDEGAGTPVVFLHGLTFDRRTWRPIIERLDHLVDPDRFATRLRQFVHQCNDRS